MALRTIRPLVNRGLRNQSSAATMVLQKQPGSPTVFARFVIPPDVAKKAGFLAGVRADICIDEDEDLLVILPSPEGRLKLVAQTNAKANKVSTLYVRGALPPEDAAYLECSAWSYDGVQVFDGVKALVFCASPGTTPINTVVKRKVK
jgi:hypothetical protein